MNPKRCQTGPACNPPTPIEGGKQLRNVKDEFGRRGEEWRRVRKARWALRPRTWVYTKINNTPVIGGLLASRRSPFSPSLILNSYAHLRPLRMSGAQVFSNAHDIAVSGGTLYTADTVSGTVRYPPNKLIAWIPGRCTSTTSTTIIGRHLMGSFSLCPQIRAIDSQGERKSSPISRGIFPTQMTHVRRKSFFCCMGWGVLERLKFA